MKRHSGVLRRFKPRSIAAAFVTAAIVMAAAVTTGLAIAQQNFPNRTVNLIVPWPAGSAMDLLARSLAAELNSGWGHPVIVENIPGAGSIIGAQKAANAAPDGHTLMITVNDTVVHNRFVHKNLPYDPDKSFVAVTMLARSGQFVLAHPKLEASTLQGLVELAKRKPATLSFASFGNGTRPHVLFAAMNQREGIDLLHVPYKGVGPAIAGVVGGEVHLSLASPGQSGEMIRAGRLKPLALAAAERSKAFPGVPTVAEAGFPYLEAPLWFGLFAPAGTPPAVIERIHRDATAVLRRPDFAEKNVTARGFELVASSPAQFAQAIGKDVAATALMVRTAGLQLE